MTVLDNTPPPATDQGPAPGARPEPRPGSRAARARMPLAADVVEAAAISFGVCIRPVSMKATNDTTGEVAFIDVPCGATLSTKCPPCAERARRLRVHQCREGWHLGQEPDLTPDHPNEHQVQLAVERADITAARDLATDAGDDLEAMAHTEAITDADAELRKAGVRGDIDPAKPERRARSTRRRDDAPGLPKKEATDSTIGRAFTGHDGTVFRPSMFLTLTLPSYGRVHPDGTPRNPGTYDYRQAARDAIGFSALVDRFVQNLRRVAGYDVQYFAAVEPQRRLTAHVHFAIRGSIPRAVIRRVVDATYRQIWWPTPGQPVYDDQHAPQWAPDGDGSGRYFDPDAGAALTTWDQALDQLDQLDDLAADGIGDGALPFHVLRFGSQVDLQGLLAGSDDSERRIGYLAKYLTKSMTDAHQPDDDDPDAGRQAAHVDRLHAALQAEPCSPCCANWLRYGIQPKNPRAGMTPGSCRSKAHKREHLGYAGRRILVSRKWTGKTLADHKYDRRAWVLATLGIVSVDSGPGSRRADLQPDPDLTDASEDHEAADQLLQDHGTQSEAQDEGANASNDLGQAGEQHHSGLSLGLPLPLHDAKRSHAARTRIPADKTRDQWRWEPAARDDPIGSPQHRLLRAIADRQRWRAEYEAARDGTTAAGQQLSAILDSLPDSASAA